MFTWLIAMIGLSGVLFALAFWDKTSMGELAAFRKGPTIIMGEGAQEAVEAKQKEEEKVDKVTYSEAYIKGYKDMAIGAGLPATRKITKYRNYPDSYYMYINSEDCQYEVEIGYILTNSEDGSPVCPDAGLKEIALKMLDENFKIDIAAGQVDRTFMGGSDEDFKDYYKGGMAFIADVDEMKTHIVDECTEEARVDRLIEQRKKGLVEINTKVELSMEALDELRFKTFEPRSFEENWNNQMKEIENA